MSPAPINVSHLVQPHVSPITCIRESQESVLCNGTLFDLPEPLIGPSSPMFWVYVVVYVCLVLFAGKYLVGVGLRMGQEDPSVLGMMAGLVLAIMSIDSTSLKVLIAAGTPESKKYAMRIAPFVKRYAWVPSQKEDYGIRSHFRHHLVLVTLVLANAAAVESMPIFLDRISDPITAVLVSSTAVLIFGE